MKTLWLSTIVSFVVWSSLALAAEPAQDIAGVYLAKDRDHRIELFMAGAELRGRIVWTKEQGLRDKENKDPKMRGRLVAGIEHLRGLKRVSDNTWDGGTLYNPEDGKLYDSKLWLEGDKLVIRGQPRIAVMGRLLGALFGRITYVRERAPSKSTASAAQHR